MEQKASFIWDIVKIFVVALIIVVPIRYFLFQPFIVKGDSMVPNFHSGDYLIIDEISYRFSNPQRGDVVVFKYPRNTAQRFIKRVIGLPGETVEVKNGEVFVYNQNNEQQVLKETYIPDPNNTYGDLKVTLAPNEFFVLGDNRPYSSDSRMWGSVPRANIIGKVFMRIFPLAALGRMQIPVYQ